MDLTKTTNKLDERLNYFYLKKKYNNDIMKIQNWLSFEVPSSKYSGYIYLLMSLLSGIMGLIL